MYPRDILWGNVGGFFMAVERSIGMALLKDIQCRSAQVEAGKSESNFRDGGGLWLVVSVDRKRWRYVGSLYGKRIKVWLGDYPKLSLKQARQGADICRESIRQGKAHQSSGSCVRWLVSWLMSPLLKW